MPVAYFKKHAALAFLVALTFATAMAVVVGDKNDMSRSASCKQVTVKNVFLCLKCVKIGVC